MNIGDRLQLLFSASPRLFFKADGEVPRQICQVVSVKELDKAYACGKFAAMLTVEGGSVLAGDLSRIELLSKLGVKMMTLTWNGENEIGSGNSTDHGLTPFGEEVIPEMERNRIVIDVSHLNEAGFWQAAKIAKYPMAASHSNCRAVWDHPRNLRDDQIRYIIQTGGIVGLNFYIGFINGQQNPKPQDLLKHVEHFWSWEEKILWRWAPIMTVRICRPGWTAWKRYNSSTV